jgi:PAS domain S-box-containing protein
MEASSRGRGRGREEAAAALLLAASGVGAGLVAGVIVAGHSWLGALGLLALTLAVVAGLIERRSRAERAAAPDRAVGHQRRLLDALPVAVAELDGELRFRYVNAAHEEWFDCAGDNLLGRRLVDVLHGQSEQLLVAAGHALAGRRSAVEATLPSRGGHRHVVATLVPCAMEERATGFIAVLVDVTSEVRAHEQDRFLVNASEVLFSELDVDATLRKIADLAVPILADCAAVEVVQEDGRVDQIGFAHDDSARLVLGAEIRRRYPPRDDRPGVGRVVRTGVAELWNGVDDGDLATLTDDEGHLELLRRMRPSSSLIVPMIARGKVLGAIALHTARESGRRYTDADRPFAEELARRAALAIENARLYDLASKAVTAREELLAVVAHDLRNPLGVIQMKTEMMKELIDALPDRRGLNIDVIQCAARRMDALVAALADATRLRAERLTVDCVPCDLTALTHEAMQVLGTLASGKGVELALVPDDAEPVVTAADPERIFQVLFNLIGNAIKFTPRGGHVSVHVGSKDDGSIQVDVCDDGAGIPAEDQAHIFDRFWQGKPGRRSAGLGLYIARGIVRAHHGDIRVESQPGCGSTFTFTLPPPAPQVAARSLNGADWTQQATPIPH